MMKIHFFAILLVSLTAGLFLSPPCSAAALSCQNGPFLQKPRSDAEWLWARPENPRGVAILVHGLNTNPRRMQGIRDIFIHNGFETMSITLSGHGGDLQAFKHTSREIWLQDLFAGYCLARARALELGVPLYYAGYSLGGLLGIDLLTSPDYEGVDYDKILLLAPALVVRKTSKLAKSFKLFGESFMVPSANPPRYRANKAGTSVAAYNALFDSIKALESRNLRKANRPTLVLMDFHDELISPAGILRLRSREKLTQWRIQVLKNPRPPFTYHHLIIDEASVGPANWRKMQFSISRVLFQE